MGVALGAMRRHVEERRSLLEGLGALYARGYALDWKKQQAEGGRVVLLPSYPWQRERYWFSAPAIPARRPRQALSVRSGAAHPLLGMSTSVSALPGMHLWEQALYSNSPAYLEDHRVLEQVVFPAAGYVEMALSAGVEIFPGAVVSIEDLTLDRMLALPTDEERIVQTVLTAEGDSVASFQISSRAERETGWQRHAVGKVRGSQGEALPPTTTERPAALRARLGTVRTGTSHYSDLRTLGLDYGPAFQGVVDIALGEGQVLGRVQLPERIKGAGHTVHPALLDACLQVSAGLFGARGADAASEEAPYVPVAIARVRVHRLPEREVWVLAGMSADQGTEDARERVVDLRLLDEDGATLVEVLGMRLRRVEGALRAQRGLEELLFEVAWERTEPSPEASLSREGAWLIFSDRGGVGASLRALLAHRGQRCVQVVAGTAYGRIEPDVYRIDPQRREDHGRLMRDAFGEGGACLGAVHLFSLDATPFDHATPENLSEDLARGTESAAYLGQALLRQGWRDMPRLVLITRGAQQVADTDEIAVSQAPLWGLGRTIALEHPELRCLRIDLDPAAGAGDAALLLRELVAQNREDQIALRGGVRHVARIVRGRVEAHTPRASKPQVRYRLEANASYLITGGLGGLGLELGRWMVERGVKHLALVGRRAPDERARVAIAAMEAAGARVLTVQADVARREDVQQLMESVGREGPPLRGVVHAAAVLDDHTLLELSAENFRSVFAPKVLGAFHLHQATGSQELAFFLMYSSAAALFGSPGQGNYTAANAFLDALARLRDRTHRPSMSVQWGAFSAVGLAAAEDIRGKRIEARGSRNLTPEEGLAGLAQLFEHPRPEVAVARFDVRQWLEFYPRAAALPFFAVLQGEAGATRRAQGDARRVLEEAPPAAREGLLRRHLLEQAASVLRVDVTRLDPAAPLQSSGVDSLMSLELRNRLEASLSVRLSATLLFTYPTVASLTGYLLAELWPAEQEPPQHAVEAPLSDKGAVVAAISQMTERETTLAVEAELAALEDYLQ
ncbi:Malonyl CoA-acyl carrier protein transacylase [Chondromyces apiculatus DSM 436]|uniref:Malonyl CoA-acyl carrier protein transacylase n=1 Tax=Chondromyces apiculatus DSM 436 TaxID=1192034 RepID=A0A017T6U9_9BACT|nr:Malonyl CoA-acyl carrier protein transacylase [Chondromyces apiculatus DSM 436]